MAITNWMYVLFGLGTINLAIAYFTIKSFLAQTPAITNDADLDRFKNLTRVNMYAALFQIILLGAGGLLGLYGVVTGQVGLTLVIILNGIIFAVAKLTQNSERHTRNLQVTSDFLKSQYTAICEAWVNDTIPKF
jgi:hypothetical protein